MQRRAATSGSNEIEAGNERCAGADPDNCPSEKCELEAAVDEEETVPDDGGCDCTQRDLLRAETISTATCGQLYREMGDEERRR